VVKILRAGDQKEEACECRLTLWLLFCFLAFVRSAASSTMCSHCQDILPCLRPKAVDPVDLGLKPVKL
jgi:hypothetical protein